jgi:hypothetical protein
MELKKCPIKINTSFEVALYKMFYTKGADL